MYRSLEKRSARPRWEALSAPAGDPCSEQQSAVLTMIQRVLTDFDKDWNLLREEAEGEDWPAAANELLDRYSHEMYDLVRAIQGILAEDMEFHVRGLSADMIMATNICHMIGCGREFLIRGDELARRARSSADRCILMCRARRRVRVVVR
ncbi:hypothetical protein ABH15_02780 [Methanoculleus taiwanensis]|uniref:PhoU domain-containing protein n=1 Tax=Methanoculleus taiwanensis TaxID=1550565 RepID=A0A498H2C7_9EURY|nr:hypothetical protein [Methanoculleus taiwanensis]RXE57072.1 hypothetical protein ABH15_02780 [Methanoculleus taiwanensis]